MPSAHNGRIQPFFNDCAGAGLDHRFASQESYAMSLFFQIGFHAIGLILRNQARFGMGVLKPQPRATREDFLDRHAPFTGKGFYPLSRHLTYFIEPLTCYPVLRTNPLSADA